MKKVLSIIAMATLAVLFCGCNKENAPATGSKSVTISASMPDDEITTKTDLVGRVLTWNENDKIYISGPGGAQSWAGYNAPIIPSSISEDGKTADFTLFVRPDDDGGKVVGYYGRKAGTANDYLRGGWYSIFDDISYISYTNACVQEYYDGRGPLGEYLVMADINPKEFGISSKQLQFGFKNLMSIIKIPVSSRSARTLSSIIVDVKDGGGDPVSGTFKSWEIRAGGITPECWGFDPMIDNNDRCEPIAEDFSKGTYGCWVKLDNINVTLKESAQYFYLVVFPGQRRNLDFTLFDNEGNRMAAAWRDGISMQPCVIYTFPTITWD